MSSNGVWKSSFNQALNTLTSAIGNKGLLDACASFENMAYDCIQSGGNMFSCGNGGSHCDAMHFAEEWTGRYRKNRRPIGALALGDPSHQTCVSNDFGFEHIFERQLQALGRKGDLLIGISTSGQSKNVINAVKAAKNIGIKTVALLGKDGGELAKLVDCPIIVPGDTTDRIQEMHIKIIHILIESVERRLFPENYK